MTRLILSSLVLLATVACGVTLPPITIEVPPPATPGPPQAPDVAPPAPPPVPVEPTPVVEPAPEPEPEPTPEPAPLVNLNIVVHDAATGAGIPRAACTVGDDSRTADGSGFINFAVSGPVVVRCAAGGYQARPEMNLPPGDHRFPLVAVAPPPAPEPPPAPPVVAPPSSGMGFPGCGKSGNTMAISSACLSAVSTASKSYPLCEKGDAVACHRFTREVALALRTTQSDTGWGLITKPLGQQACTMTACGRNVRDGYGEDMVAYLPAGNPVNLWTGLDIVGGAGAPGARWQSGTLPPATGGRPDNLWAPVP
jgi:hypothetical protein